MHLPGFGAQRDDTKTSNNIMGKQAVILKNPNISWKINSIFTSNVSSTCLVFKQMFPIKFSTSGN